MMWVVERIGSGKGWCGTVRMVAELVEELGATGVVGRRKGSGRARGWLHARHCFEQACTRTYIYLAHR